MPPNPAPVAFRALWSADLPQRPPDRRWLWSGYLAPGCVTLLTSPWKVGKTTLLAALLARLGPGGLLAGQTVQAGRAVVVTEESPQQWHDRARRCNFGSHVCFLCRPFRSKPDPADWGRLLLHLLELHAQYDLSLAVIDPLATFLPGRSENDASLMLEALLPLQQLTDAGLAVLLLHHPSKKACTDGQRARGSGALSGHADILLELATYPGAGPGDRRRLLMGYARFEETPKQRVIELNAEGTDYRSLGDVAEEEFTGVWERLRTVLAEAKRKWTQREIRAAWPAERWPCPSQPTLSRWLDRAVATGTVHRDGLGHDTRPYRYWLFGQEEKWRAEYSLEAIEQADQDLLREKLGME